MTPAALRLWMLHGQAVRIQTGNPGANVVNAAPTAPANGTQTRYMPITVDHVMMDAQLGNHLHIQVPLVGAAHAGVFLPDVANQCTIVDATTNSNGIAVSGPFNGCTFGKCVNGAGHLIVGHIFVDAGLAGNNPATQAVALKAAAGLLPGGAAQGFRTLGLVAPPAQVGYVIGTFAGGVWQWNWLTMTLGDLNNKRSVVQRQTLVPADWVAI
jgi:hypothetical protein